VVLDWSVIVLQVFKAWIHETLSSFMLVIIDTIIKTERT
jgi:hypothetical protein